MNSMKTAAWCTLALVVALGAFVPRVRATSGGLDGKYRLSWTEKEAIAAGAPYRSAHADFGFAHDQRVVITITFRAGRFSLRDTSRRPTCIGSYTSSEASVSVHQKSHCHGLVVARWSLTGRLLRLKVTKATDPGDVVVFGAKPWRKIG